LAGSTRAVESVARNVLGWLEWGGRSVIVLAALTPDRSPARGRTEGCKLGVER
jgi:hypothetical protein